MGSNDHPGDYRSSGCTACHVVYANDRSPFNSGWYSKYGNQGLSFSMDPTIPKNERGHPIKHQFTTAIPSSQCMICHMHQGNLFVNPYLGYTWWDQETDGEYMYPKVQKDPTDEEAIHSCAEESRGRRGARTLGRPQLPRESFRAEPEAQGHAVRRLPRPRLGLPRDLQEGPPWRPARCRRQDHPPDDPDKFAKAVHLKDIHLEKGMQCVDCHFMSDVHGNGMLYGETAQRHGHHLRRLPRHHRQAARR
jgi:hypothetical protein